MTCKNCCTKRKTVRKIKKTFGKCRKNGGMFRQSIKKVGLLTEALIKEVTKSKVQDAFKTKVKKWENRNDNKENSQNVSNKNLPKMEI